MTTLVTSSYAGAALSLLAGAVSAKALLAGLLPHGHDTLLHVYRLLAFRQALASGVLYPRWLQSLAFGYGAPVLHFYAPLWYYLAALPTLFGLNEAQATTVAAAAVWCLGAVGMFLWMHSLLHAWRPALVASVAFATAPYLSFNFLHRGAFPEALALCVAPFAFWSLHQWTVGGKARFALLAPLMLALLVLCHTLSALLLVPLIAGYGLLVGLSAARPLVAMIWRPVAASVIGLMLSAFFWLPALTDQGAIQVERAFVQQELDFRRHFITLGEVLSFPPVTEAQLINNALPRSLSWVAIGLALPSLRVVFSSRSKTLVRRVTFATLACLGACLWLSSPLAQWVWEQAVPLRFIQFPWRLTGTSTLLLSVLVGVGYAAVEAALPRLMSSFCLGIAVIVLSGYGAAWQFPTYHRITPPLILEAIADFERRLNVPTLSSGEYLSRSTQVLPERDAKGLLEPLNFPNGVVMVESSCSALSCAFTVDARAATTLPLNAFYFPAWRGYLNEQPHPLIALPPHGLVGIVVPSGRHRVRVAFEHTPAGRLGEAASAVAVVSVGGVAMFARFWRRRAFEHEAAASVAHLRDIVVLLVALGCALALKAVLARDTPLHRVRFDGERVVGASLPLHVNFDNQLALIGADATWSVAVGSEWEVALYWRPLQPTRRNYHTALQIMDATGALIAQSNAQRPGGVPTALWPLGSYVRDRHVISLPPGTPPGEYYVQVVAYEADSPDRRLTVRERSRGVPRLDSVDPTAARIARLRVTPPPNDAPHATEAVVVPEHRLGNQTNSALRLIGHGGLPEQLGTGEAFRVALYWTLQAPVLQPITPEIRLARLDEIALQLAIEPIPGYPLTQWRIGEVWRAPIVIRIPPNTPGGEWTLEVIIEGQHIPVGVIRVDAPTRLFTAPRPQYALDVQIGDFARLVGYDATLEVLRGSVLRVVLHWQALAESSLRYKVFVQLLDAEGERKLGSDGTPVKGERPTTSWVRGEFLTDAHEMAIPDSLAPGTYDLVAGLYEEFTLARLSTSQGKDAIVLGQVIVR